jgi:demethylmenaquinone methyltransferase/2-methoxy-6-polyprenyl-1,4-benzoquinol methylase
MDMGFEPAYFDGVICFACFPHFQDPKGALKEISRVLKPGGILTVAHLMSSAELDAHHKTETAVSGDRLPPREWMHTHFKDNGLSITSFTDKPGLFCLTGVKADGKTGQNGRRN